MADPKAQATTKRGEMDQWLIKLDPQIQAEFDRAFDQYEDAKKTAGPDERRTLENSEDALVESARKMAEAHGPKDAVAKAPAETRADNQPTAGGGSVKAGTEVEVVTKEFPPYQTKYGKITVSSTIKAATALISAGGSSGLGSSSNATLKDKKEGRTSGIKQGFSTKAIQELDLLKGFSLTDVSVGVEGEISGTEVSVVGTFTFNIVTAAFQAPASAKLIIVKGKVGEGLKVGGVELKVSPTEFKIKIGGIETKLTAEFKVTFVVDLKKVGIEIVEKIAKKELKKAAEKQGVKILGREAGELVLKDLGPLAFAFGVGLDIGGLLNEYTVAPKVAGMVDEDILGDLNERYHQASTLGKMALIYDNKERIVAALIASGVAGVVAGIGDLVLFRIMGLDKLKGFGEAFKAFVQILKVLKVDLGAAMGSLIFSNAVRMGIKFNPKHGKINDPSFAKLGQLVYDELQPLFKTNGGLNRIIQLTVKDISLPQADLLHIVKKITDEKLNYGGQINFSEPTASVIDSFFEFGMSTLIQFMEFNKLVKYDVSFSPDLSIEAIDPKLVAEVFG